MQSLLHSHSNCVTEATDYALFCCNCCNSFVVFRPIKYLILKLGRGRPGLTVRVIKRLRATLERGPLSTKSEDFT